MRGLIFLLLMAGLFSSCGSSTVPADIISEEKMGIIIWQLMQSDEYANNLLRDSTKKSSTVRMKLYQQVFDLNKTSKDEFKKSYQFYMAHPDITKVMFDSLNARASRQRTELNKPADSTATGAAGMLRLQIQRRKADSIMKAHGQHINATAPDSVAIKSIIKRTGLNKLKTDSAKTRLKRIKLRKPKHHVLNPLKKA